MTTSSNSSIYSGWRDKFGGKSVIAGDHDITVAIALRLGWTKSQTDAEDPEFIYELLEAIKAEADDAKERSEADNKH